jgi:hypothetical protein
MRQGGTFFFVVIISAVLVQMQWQLIPETTMHAFNINALLTMIAISKLTDRTGADPEMTGN